jgi:hypothetical protein
MHVGRRKGLLHNANLVVVGYRQNLYIRPIDGMTARPGVLGYSRGVEVCSNHCSSVLLDPLLQPSATLANVRGWAGSTWFLIKKTLTLLGPG